jgi:pyruvate dehydrogenase E2 component (dihydrolipoamide acetyltransferase)
LKRKCWLWGYESDDQRPDPAGRLRALLQHPEINALFTDDTVYQYKNVHLAVAVDTPRGLMVPVIRQANTLSLKQISQEAKRLASACLEGIISPDELAGGTFTVTNLGNLGIESFTPVLNPPQVAILGREQHQFEAGRS